MMKKLYIIPKTESFKFDLDAKFLSCSNENNNEGDNGDEGLARQRGGYYNDNTTRNGNQRGKGWGSLW